MTRTTISLSAPATSVCLSWACRQLEQDVAVLTGADERAVSEVDGAREPAGAPDSVAVPGRGDREPPIFIGGTKPLAPQVFTLRAELEEEHVVAAGAGSHPSTKIDASVEAPRHHDVPFAGGGDGVPYVAEDTIGAGRAKILAPHMTALRVD